MLKPSPKPCSTRTCSPRRSLAAGLPPGVVNIVPGGREIGAYLVQHRDVDKVAFTGSTAAGRQIAETCGRLLRPVSLELGGKSAAIVLDDADLDLAKIGQDLFAATLVNNGQTCYLGHPDPGPAVPVRRGRRHARRVRRRRCRSATRSTRPR